MPPRLIAPIAALLLLVLAAPAALAQETPGQREREREHAKGKVKADVPGGEATVSPSQFLASEHHKLTFSVDLKAPVKGARLVATLPERWVSVPASGLRAIRDLNGRAGAPVRRAGRQISLTVNGSGSAFTIEDNGIPGGTYDIPLRWIAPDGTATDAGEVSVKVLARSKEGEENDANEARNPWARVTPVRLTNASNDAIEESESAIGITPG